MLTHLTGADKRARKPVFPVMTFTICFIIPAPYSVPVRLCPAYTARGCCGYCGSCTPFEALLKRLPEHAKPHGRFRSKVGPFQTKQYSNRNYVYYISTDPSGPLTVQAADSHRKCQTINYIWFQIQFSLCVSLCLLSCLGTLSTAHTRHANDQIQQIWESVSQTGSGKWNFC